MENNFKLRQVSRPVLDASCKAKTPVKNSDRAVLKNNRDSKINFDIKKYYNSESNLSNNINDEYDENTYDMNCVSPSMREMFE